MTFPFFIIDRPLLAPRDHMAAGLAHIQSRAVGDIGEVPPSMQVKLRRFAPT